MSIGVKLTGDRALMAKLDRLGAAGKGAALANAARAGAMPIVNEVKGRTPIKSGTYRRSVHAGEPQVSGDSVSIEVGSDVVYGPRLEFGFFGADSLGRVYHQAARPHWRPGLEASKGAAEQEVSDAIRALIGGAV